MWNLQSLLKGFKEDLLLQKPSHNYDLNNQIINNYK